MKIKKLKILTLFLMAFFAFGCVDNQKEKTKPAPTPAPKPPVVEPTTEPATEPFTIEITDIKEFFGNSILVDNLKLGLTNANNILVKQIKNENKKFIFKDLAVGEYKICLLDETNKCGDYLTVANSSINNKDAKLFNNNAKLEFKLAPTKSVKIIIDNANFENIQKLAFGSMLDCDNNLRVPPSYLNNSKEIIFYPFNKDANCKLVIGEKDGKKFEYIGTDILRQFISNPTSSSKITFNNEKRVYNFKLP